MMVKATYLDELLMVDAVTPKGSDHIVEMDSILTNSGWLRLGLTKYLIEAVKPAIFYIRPKKNASYLLLL